MGSVSGPNQEPSVTSADSSKVDSSKPKLGDLNSQNWLYMAIMAAYSMQNAISGAYPADAGLTELASNVNTAVNNEVKAKLDADAAAVESVDPNSKNASSIINQDQTQYNLDSSIGQSEQSDAQANVQIPQDSASRDTTASQQFVQFQSTMMGVMSNLAQALSASGS